MAKLTIKLDTQEVLAVLEDKLKEAEVQRIVYEREYAKYKADMIKFKQELADSIGVPLFEGSREYNGTYSFRGKGILIQINPSQYGHEEPEQPRYPDFSPKELDDLKVTVASLKMCKQPTVSASQLGDIGRLFK